MNNYRARLPRAVTAPIVGAIALASLVGSIWSPLSLSVNEAVGAPQVGVIRRQIDGPNMVGRIGARAPDFEWNGPDGSTRTIAGLRGRVVVLNFWATWCEPCRREMPLLSSASRDSDAVFLPIDLQESGATVGSFVDQLALDVEPLLDLHGQTSRRYGVVGLPITFFIDREGIIRHVERGEVRDATTVCERIAEASSPGKRSFSDYLVENTEVCTGRQ